MGSMVSQITSLTIVYSAVYSGADHRGPVNAPLKWPVTRKMFPFDDVIMYSNADLSQTRPTRWLMLRKNHSSSTISISDTKI